MKVQIISICMMWLMLSCHSKEINPLIQKHVSAWENEGIALAKSSQEVMDDLIQRKDSSLFKNEITALYEYIAQTPNQQIEAFTLLYHVTGSHILKLQNRPGAELLEYAILLAERLNNEILISQIYSALSTYYGSEDTHLLYSLKSIEIQERLGIEKYSDLARKYYDVSIVLYNVKEYDKSIELSLKSLKTLENHHYVRDSTIFIHLYDVLGNSYLKKDMIDSADYYFRLGHTYTKNTFISTEYNLLWRAIFVGNIGRIEFITGKSSDSFEKISYHKEVSTQLKDSLNIAIANIRLADIYLKNKEEDKAVHHFKLALEVAEQIKKHDLTTYAADHLVNIYTKRQDYKNALIFEQISDQHSEVHQKYLDNVNLNRVHALQIMERTQVELEKSKAALALEKNKRMNLTYFIGFIAVVAITIILRMKMKNKHRLLMTQKENEALAMEMNYAKTQINDFKKNIIEKNNLIDQLKKKIDYKEQINLYQSVAENTLITEDEWEKFKLNFVKIYPKYQVELKKYLPQPTPAEQRLLCLLILGLETQQIGNALGISKDSVARGKRRLKNRLQLSAGIEIEEFIDIITK